MKKITKDSFNDVKTLVQIVNDNVFDGEKHVIAEMISECDEYVFSKVKEAYPMIDQDPLIKAVYLGRNEILFIIVQNCPMGISVSMVKKEVIDDYFESGSLN